LIKDLNRKLIKSEYATINIPEVGLEIPPKTQKGKLTTIEGFLSTAKEQFENAMNEGVYDELDEDTKNKIKEMIVKLGDVIDLKSLPIKVILDDPSGNSFIENPFAPQTDPYIKVLYYERTKEMAESMGYSYTPKEENKDETNHETAKKEFVKPSYYNKNKEFMVYKSGSEISAHLIDFTRSIQENSNIKEEALTFPTNCYCCYAPGEAYMCLCTIPYFKEIIISCFKCQVCGYKTTEVKGGGGISDKATKYTLHIKNPSDLNRDLFKSETAQINIPELGFETDTGSMGSMFTTVEGLIDKISSSLGDIPFSIGDSSDDSLSKVIQSLKNLVLNNTPFTLIIDDSLSNSFVSSPGDPAEDTQLIKEEYERTWEQNEELGLNDMKVENYTEEVEN
jgi:zinc finger protein